MLRALRCALAVHNAATGTLVPVLLSMRHMLSVMDLDMFSFFNKADTCY